MMPHEGRMMATIRYIQGDATRPQARGNKVICPARRPRRLRTPLARRPRDRPLGEGTGERPPPGRGDRGHVEVVQLFAVLHDSRRLSEATDPDHGPRAAEFAGRCVAVCSTCPTTSSASCTGPVPATPTSGRIPT